MSGIIFPVKALAIVVALRGVLGEIAPHNHENMGTNVGPDDGRTRMALASPDVCNEVQKMTGVKYFRVRFAFFAHEVPFLQSMPRVEIYDVDGKPLMEPIEASKLADPLAYAVQLELFHFLLKLRGLDITMW